MAAQNLHWGHGACLILCPASPPRDCAVGTPSPGPPSHQAWGFASLGGGIVVNVCMISAVTLFQIPKEFSDEQGFDFGAFLPRELALVPEPCSEWLCLASGLKAEAPGSPVLALLGVTPRRVFGFLCTYICTCVHV